MEELKVALSVRMLPNDYTCDGENRSPQVTISGVNPSKAACLAVIVTDSDSPGGGGFVHWIIWNIELVKMLPEKIPKTPEVSFPVQAVQGMNDFGKIGYWGPCPPHGQTHRYFFKVYSLDSMLAIPPGAGKEQMTRAMQGHIVQFGETYVTYGR